MGDEMRCRCGKYPMVIWVAGTLLYCLNCLRFVWEPPVIVLSYPTPPPAGTPSPEAPGK